MGAPAAVEHKIASFDAVIRDSGGKKIVAAVQLSRHKLLGIEIAEGMGCGLWSWY